MAESIEELQGQLKMAIAAGVRDRLLDRGMARGLIWRAGVLPEGSPPFSEELTEDLLDYGYSVMSMALRLRTQSAETSILERAFLVAGESIEAAVHRGAGRQDLGFHRVSAAISFHLARYAARAYSMLPIGTDAANLAPTEKTLVHLLRRKLDHLTTSISSWLLNVDNDDNRVAARLHEDEEFDELDATHTIITTSFMRGVALFAHAIMVGNNSSAAEAIRRMGTTADAAADLHAVSHWWTATLALHLIDELWRLSLYEQIPNSPHNDNDHDRWEDLRRSYIQRLRAGKQSAIELWPSQLEAAARSIDPSDDLVVALPTSAGKTRIAELCILRALASDRRIVYVTPLRALSAQIERDLAETFRPLGFSVSSLYGSAGIESGDSETLRNGKIVVSTPEKLDFALRNDPTLIDDVGLIVLDEGHMLGPNEREVRYEALVQRILRRSDASSRRLVCLSALFPSPADMSDLIAWIRQDEPGGPVHSTWRPTRQRFGVIRWLSDAARLEVRVEEEKPFVPKFITVVNPPSGSRRRKLFPGDKNELTLAAAWQFVEQEKAVLVYCALRMSVETLGRLVLKCIKHGVLTPLREVTPRIQDAMATGNEWLGADHPAVQCLQYGIALHHGGLPRPFLNEVERLLRSGDCPITIASPTLAQGLNLSASVLLVPSIWRNHEVIPAAEFANVAGRSGRAFVDVEGLVLHVVWEQTINDTKYALRNWDKLVAAAKAPRVISGILNLTIKIYDRIAQSIKVSMEEVVDYVTGHTDAWDFNDSAMDNIHITSIEWERDIASLDAAILAMLDAETEESSVQVTLDEALEGSLFSRQLANEEEQFQKLLRRFVAARAHRIWSVSSVVQRKGYHIAGIGLRAGQFIDTNLVTLMSLLFKLEDAVLKKDAGSAAEAAVEFAELVFQIAPFRAPGDMPEAWKDALQIWMEGKSAADVITICRDDGADFLQEALTYRLPWAMEAVRVHATAVGYAMAEILQGLAALAVEAGNANLGVITLLRNGLSSREAAIAAVTTTGATFENRNGMLEWLHSDEVQAKNSEVTWPTPESRHAWTFFYEMEKKGDLRKWKRKIKFYTVKWTQKCPKADSYVIISRDNLNSEWYVLTPDYLKLGNLQSNLDIPDRYIVNARVSEKKLNNVEVEFFGPEKVLLEM